MKKASVVLLVIGASALALFPMTELAHADKPAEFTCSTFLKVPNPSKAHVIYYVVGVHTADKQNTADLTAKDFNHPVNKIVKDVVTECTKDQSTSLWDAIVKHFYWRAMQIP